MNIKVVFLLGIIATAVSWNFKANPFRGTPEVTSSNQQLQYFDQILDHFSYLPAQFWKQRYYVDASHFTHNGPVMLLIGGEGPCGGISETSWTYSLAQQTGALIIALEHRYYGESLPLRQTSFETANMKYLSSKQALRDIAFFIEQVNKNHWYDVSESNKWITVGGSYSGALSAWFRTKYPHLTVGAIASSGVILAVEDFKQFDEQIYLSAMKSGEYCVDAIRQVTEKAENMSLAPDRIAFQAQFKAEKLTSREFMFYWSDAIVFQMQYGNRSAFCSSLRDKLTSQQFQVVKQLVIRVSPMEYGSFYLSNPQLALETSSGIRPWYYQCCTEFSYFQTFSEEHPMRSRMLTIDFYRKWCEDSYGVNTWASVNRTNLEYGGLHLRATNLIMTNGDEDPWKWASLLKSYKGVTAKVANCTNCAHCCDLHAPTKNDPKQLTTIRNLQLSLVKKWIS